MNRTAIVSAIVALGASIGQAEARCAGTAYDPLTPQNIRCDPKQFLDPAMKNPAFWRNDVARTTMVEDCARTVAPYPGWKRPPADWCRTAMAVQTGKWGR